MCLTSAALPLIVMANCYGFLEAMSLNDKKDLANLLAKITFSLGGILLFVLGQALSFHQKYVDVDSLRIAYRFLSWVSILLIIFCVMDSLFSIIYIMTATALWIFLSALFFLVISAVLVFVALLFGICALTRWMV